MCGIAGLVRFGGLRDGERGLGPIMAATLRHRGPDESGRYVDAWASLGHARLSIIDPDAGRQPMSNEHGTIQVIFNGEIYNHRELTSRLVARGHQLRTRCDTEVIAHAYEDYGDEFVHQLNGMFAIALWDARRRRLMLVRDRMGIKPLYWHATDNAVVFGSELKAVLASGVVARTLDPAALKDYLTFGHVPAPRTILQHVHKLEPGHLAICTPQRIHLRRYWDIPCHATAADEPAADAAEQRQWTTRFAELLQDVVAMRLEADVPLGAFLSGGVDSSLIVAAMRAHAAGRVMTHTVGFTEADHDERAAARRIAARLGTDHREIVVQPDAVTAAHRLVHHFDEPFADPCAVPTFYLSQAARQRVTVALSGDGPDEMLAGYRRYRFDLAEQAARHLAPAWLRRSIVGVAGRLYPKGDWLPRSLRARRTLQNIASDAATAHLRSVAIGGGELPALLLHGDVLAATTDHDPFARGRACFERYRGGSLLDRLLYVDMKTLLADEILTKVDRASMAVGLEVRVPFLDYRLVELSRQLPVSLKLSDNRGKQVLHRIADEWIGPGVVPREKHGFDVPTDAWFRGPLRELAHDLLLSRSAASRAWIDAAAVQRMVEAHEKGISHHGQVLWSLLMLELWAAGCSEMQIGSDAGDAMSIACGESNRSASALAGVMA